MTLSADVAGLPPPSSAALQFFDPHFFNSLTTMHGPCEMPPLRDGSGARVRPAALQEQRDAPAAA